MTFREIAVFGSSDDLMKISLPSNQTSFRMKRFIAERFPTDELHVIEEVPGIGAVASVKGPTGISVLGENGWTEIPPVKIEIDHEKQAGSRQHMA